jgi:hypothetical protein
MAFNAISSYKNMINIAQAIKDALLKDYEYQPPDEKFRRDHRIKEMDKSIAEHSVTLENLIKNNGKLI